MPNWRTLVPYITWAARAVVGLGVAIEAQAQILTGQAVKGRYASVTWGVLAVGVLVIVLTSDAVVDRYQARRESVDLGGLVPTPLISTLPVSIPLVGRDAELRDLRGLLLSGERTILIHGPGGVGKSVLAKAFANAVVADREQFADLVQFHWISVKATDSNEVRDVAWLSGRLHRALGFIGSPAADRGERRELEIRQALSQTPTFLVVDNFEDLADDGAIDWLLGLLGSTRIILTSRVALDPTLPLATYPLRHLDTAYTMILFGRECDRHRMARLPDPQATQIAAAAGGSPLAIRWTVGLLAEGYPFARVMALLREGHDGLFAAIFADHWRSLTEDARDTLCAVSLLGDTFSRPLADSILDAPRDVGDLVRRSLIEPWDESAAGARRFTLHPLTRTFARRHAATKPHRREELILASVGAVTTYFDERRLLQHGRAAYLSLDQDVASVLKVDQCLGPVSRVPGDSEAADKVVALFADVSVPLWTLGYWEDRVALASRAATAAESRGYWDAAARAAGTAAIVRFWQGRAVEAESLARSALGFAERSADPLDRAVGDRVLALVAAATDRVDEGIATLSRVLESLQDRAGTAVEKVRFFADWPCPGARGHEAGLVALNQEVGITLINARRCDEAVRWLEASRGLAVAIGDHEGLAISLSHLGRCSLGLGRLHEAAEQFEEGLRLARSVGRRSTIGRCLLGLAEVSERRDRGATTGALAAEAADVFQRLGMSDEYRTAQRLSVVGPGRPRKMPRRSGRMPRDPDGPRGNGEELVPDA